MSCVLKLFKIIMTFVNFLLILITSLLIVICSITLSNRQILLSFLDLTTDSENIMIAVSNLVRKYALSTLFIATIILIIALIGCFGTLCERANALLTLYMAIMVILILVSVVIVAIIVIKNEDVINRLFGYLSRILREDYRGTHTSSDPPNSLLIDFIQIQFNCCAIEDLYEYEEAESWTNRSYYSHDSLYYPASCCVMSYNTNNNDDDDDNNQKKTFIAPFPLLDEENCMKHSQNLAENNNNNNNSGSTNSNEQNNNIYDIKQAQKFSNAYKPCKIELQSFFYRNSHYIWSIILLFFVLQYTALIFALLLTRNRRIRNIK